MYPILSFDGGGMRGLISSLLLTDLVSSGNCPALLPSTQMFAGTSTGGLIALDLANGAPPQNVVTLYLKYGSKIFTPYSPLEAEEEDASAEEPLGGPGKFYATYVPNGLRNLATQLFSGKQLQQLSRNGSSTVAISAAQLWSDNALGPNLGSWMPRCMTNLSGSPYASAAAVDAAMATSAAPTYFPPHLIAGLRDDAYNGYYADGGVVANSPVLLAISEAVKAGQRFEDIAVLSIGTGNSSYGIPDTKIGNPQNWGLDYWLDPLSSGIEPPLPLLDLALGMNQQVSTAIAGQLLGPRFFRIEPVLEPPYALDDYANLGKLVTAAKAYETSPAWKQAISFIKTYWR